MTRGQMLRIGTGAAAIALLLTAGSAVAAWGQGPGFGRGHGPGRVVMEQLDLTDAQQEQMERIHEAAAEEGKALRRQMQEIRGEMRDLMHAEQIDQGAVQARLAEMDQLQERLREHQVDTRLAMREVLTPDQVEQLAELQEQRGECDGSGPKGGRHGRMGRGGCGGGCGAACDGSGPHGAKGECDGSGPKGCRGCGGECDGSGPHGMRGGGKAHGGAGFGPGALRSLDLTDEQKDQLSELHESMREPAHDVREESAAIRKEIRALWQDDDPDRDAILAKMAEMDELHDQLREKRMETHIAVREILTPEQLEQLSEGREDAPRYGRGRQRGRGF